MSNPITGVVERLSEVARLLKTVPLGMAVGAVYAPHFDKVRTDLEALLQAQAQEAWRPEVRAFADLMEQTLRANDHKGGWEAEHPHHLFDRLKEEAGELRFVLHHNSPFTHNSALGATPEWKAHLGREAADVANFAMMIADVCGALPQPPTPQGAL
jgi:NTP pyrophosphatase (non-canonical NTP hydrolase)